MNLLALDTSTEWLSVAAARSGETRFREERAGPQNSERVLPLIRDVLADAGLRLSDVDGIAFGAGPGSFTGVRIACGVAQGLALGNNVPVIAIGTLEALAQSAWRATGATRICACLDARMREVYVALYERAGDSWREVQPPAVQKPDDVTIPAGEWQGAGDGFAVYPALAERLRLARVDATLRPTALAVAELALPRLAAGRGVAARDALPLYVRHRVALTSAERAAGIRL
jgi:tRNA threonylcarbamoyladenosine biosynthesis protein TsaB